ncbi:MAG: hypothetical protein PWQ96_1503 [Clostridia bacterium]|nr:hypothetical protein [Clostridia bacterium]
MCVEVFLKKEVCGGLEMEFVCPTEGEFFVYGLTYFILGIAIFIHFRHMDNYIAKKLWLLSAFAVIKGVAEWQHLFYPLLMDQLSLEVLNVNLGHRFLVSLSYSCLLAFGIEAIGILTDHFKYYRLLFVVMISFWFLYVFNLPNSFMAGNIVEWSLNIENASKYFLALPGGLISGIVFLKVSNLLSGNKYKKSKISSRILAFAIVCYGLVVSLYSFPSSSFPANVINRVTISSVIAFKGEQIEIFLGIVILFSFISIMMEIKEHNREKQLFLSKQELLQRERDRISRELHDGIIQSIYAITLQLEHAKFISSSSGKDELAQQLEKTKNQLTEIISELRQYIYNNNVINFRFENLSEGIENLIDEFQNISGIKVDYIFNDETGSKLNKDIVCNLYFVIKEALVNILKHSEADEVILEVNKTSKDLNLSIVDNGIGIEKLSDLQKDHKGLGLKNIEKRVKNLGGTFEISGDNGTKIELNIPLRREFYGRKDFAC